MKFLIIFIIILLLTEFVTYKVVKRLFKERGRYSKKIEWIWWVFFTFYCSIPFWGKFVQDVYVRNVITTILFLVIIVKLITTLPFLFIRLIQIIRSSIQKSSQEYSEERRSVAGKLALLLGAIPFSFMSFGVFRTATNFRIHQVDFDSSRVPSKFKGLKIVQISDMHIGSFQSGSALRKAVDMINELKPDLVFFTGDLVNNRSDEAFPFEGILRKIKSTHGVFSILGNHDYGDYEKWPSKNAYDENLIMMKKFHQKIGWNLLLNSNETIRIEDQMIQIVGVENWSKNNNFHSYGDLNKAIENINPNLFTILLSHDPSHWEAEVLNSNKYSFIDLTLSGHTHGFQFGIEIPGFKWSPSQYIYSQWAGLYNKKEQYIYVNRGLGCIGFMGRVGVPPEITLIQL